MKAEFLVNGSIKIVLIPENDLEKMMIENFSKQDIESTLIDSHTAILDKVIQNGLVIKSKLD